MKTINTYYSDFDSLKQFVNSNRDVLLASSNSSVLAQVFSGICSKDLLLEISEHIRTLVPGSQVIGATTNGEIMNGLPSGLRIVISFSIFNDAVVRLALLNKSDDSDFNLGLALGRSLDSSDARVLLVFATGVTVNASQLLKGIEKANPFLPVAGGNAGDNLNHIQSFVLANGEITDRGAAGAVLAGENLLAARHNHLGWQSIGKEMTITRSSGSRVFTIDNMPAYQVYRRYLGTGEELDILSSFEFPLVMEKNGFLVSRIPHTCHDDDSLVFFGDIDEGEKVRFSFGHINTIIGKFDSLLEWIKQQPAESIFVYSCGARRSLLGESIDMETLPLQKIAPTAGFFTDGEFFHADGSNEFLNNSITILALSESGFAPDFTCHAHPEKTAGNLKAPKDNVANRSMEILRSLTCLVNVVTDELNQRNAELESQRRDFINHLQTLYGFMNSGEIEEASNYISGLYREVRSGRSLFKLAVPEVAALLVAKMGVAANRNIAFNVQVDSDLTGLKVRAMDIVAILGNVLNNALEAVDDLEAVHRQIELKIWEDVDHFCFETHNPGCIPENIQKRIFEYGFSTKSGSANRGLGLPSILHMSRRYHGTVELTSLPDQGTTLVVKFPKQHIAI